MAITLAATTTDRIDHGTALGNFTSCSWLLWYFPTALVDINALFQMWTGSFVAPSLTVGLPGNEDDFRFTWRRGGGGSNMLYQTSNAALVVNTWYYLGVTVDQAAGAGVKVKFYRGTLNSLATLLTTDVATDPTTGFLTNNGATVLVGDNGTNTQASGGRYSGLMMFPGVVLTLLQIQQMQFKFFPQIAGCRLHAQYGLAAGTGTQRDYTGSGNNGTVTGGTLGAHVNLVNPFAMPTEDEYAYAAAAAAAFVAPRTYPLGIGRGLNRRIQVIG
jgi:hypothetical protein